MSASPIQRAGFAPEPCLRTVDLAKRFHAGGEPLVIFENLNLTIDPGEMVAIVGESGAGKSTLLQILGTLDSPSDGELYFKGSLVSGLREDQRAELRNREIGFVWQSHRLLPEFTALENASLPLRLRGMAASEAEERAAERLAEVGLAGRLRHRPGELSGGEQQRVALARALAGGPSLLLADEPTGNLDHKTGEAVFRLIEQLHAVHGLTSAIVTHNPLFAARAPRVLEIVSGELRSRS
jgi:lipoprotein-releasing system ATP-binding protein